MSSYKQALSLNVDIDGTIIPNLTTTKVLVFHFDNIMSSGEHIQISRNKIAKETLIFFKN